MNTTATTLNPNLPTMSDIAGRMIRFTVLFAVAVGVVDELRRQWHGGAS